MKEVQQGKGAATQHGQTSGGQLAYLPRAYHVLTTCLPRAYHVLTTYLPRLRTHLARGGPGPQASVEDKLGLRRGRHDAAERTRRVERGGGRAALANFAAPRHLAQRGETAADECDAGAALVGPAKREDATHACRWLGSGLTHC